MNLDRAYVLLLASIGAVAGFTPAIVSQPTRVAFVSNVRVASASALFSEVEASAEAAVEEATETAVEASTEAPAEDASSAEPATVAFDKTIYVGNISFDTVESDLRAAFALHGTVKKVQMPLDRNTGRSRGFGFIQMSSADEHAAAIEAVNESDISGRTVYVSESLPKDKVADNKRKYQKRKQEDEGTKIYVGNLNFDTTMEDLKATFAEYGEVKDCFMPSDYDGNPRGFAFIQMEEENALKAIEELHGTQLDGRTLNVNKSLPKGTKASPTQIKLYVGNLSWGTEEAALRELFEEYGKVIDCYIPTDRETGQHRGFAFVTMDPDEALRAADETDGYELDGRILRVNEAQPKGSGRSYNNNSYDGGDAYDEAQDESWGNDSY